MLTKLQLQRINAYLNRIKKSDHREILYYTNVQEINGKKSQVFTNSYCAYYLNEISNELPVFEDNKEKIYPKINGFFENEGKYMESQEITLKDLRAYKRSLWNKREDVNNNPYKVNFDGVERYFNVNMLIDTLVILKMKSCKLRIYECKLKLHDKFKDGWKAYCTVENSVGSACLLPYINIE